MSVSLSSKDRFLFLVNLLKFHCAVPVKTFLGKTDFSQLEDLPKGFRCEKSWFIKKAVGSGLKNSMIEAMRSFFEEDVEARELKQIADSAIKIVTPYSKEYPYKLKHIENPPLVLYCKGRLSLFSNPMVSIVGSRACTQRGRQKAEEIAKGLSGLGISVVSGFARGIDGSAHRGALKGGRAGSTIAVVGTGLDINYPAEHRKLKDEVFENGLLISEFPFGEQPHPWHFPLRNRIISGLSNYILVVEAGKKSGSIITARLALDQGRDVMAVPGDVGKSVSFGTNQLIRDGAVLVRDCADVLETMGLGGKLFESSSVPVEKLSSPLSDLLTLIGDGYTSLDELVTVSGLAYDRLNRSLFELMSRGFISRDSSNLYRIVAY